MLHKVVAFGCFASLLKYSLEAQKSIRQTAPDLAGSIELGMMLSKYEASTSLRYISIVISTEKQPTSSLDSASMPMSSEARYSPLR
jgi:hypothetical protein